MASVLALLLDVEGTTTPVAYVYDMLFPYARRHVRTFLERHLADPGVRDDVDRLREEHGRERGAAPAGSGAELPAWGEDDPAGSATAYVHFLTDRDRKSTALKALQGRIWEEGYRRGELCGQVYPDVPPALARWRGLRRRVAIYSSGSVLAQRLLFSTTPEGDLTRYIDAYFDTNVGPKRDAASYGRICEELGLAPGAVLFVSDVEEELDAARQAGLSTILCWRGGQAPPAAARHPVVRSFDELTLQEGAHP